MENKANFRGFSTISYWADDVLTAKKWYSELFGIEPYFERLGADGKLSYVEFRIGDYQHEFGLIDRRYQPHGATAELGGIIQYWHVDDLESTLEKLLLMGAEIYEKITHRGDGFITASVVDPFGNILGIMYNQHYLDVLASISKNESSI